MYPLLYTGASGMIAGLRTLNVVSNNLANVRTAAYRPEHTLFASYLSAEMARQIPQGQPPSYGVSVSGGWRDEQPGSLRETGNPLDLALESRGWFRVGTTAGERLTRAGTFQRAQSGRLVTPEGDPVLDDRGQPITLPDGAVVIAPDGSLTVNGAQVARLGFVDAPVAEMTREGATLWSAGSGARAMAQGEARVAQGFVEEPQVQATNELVSMIEASRLFELQQRVVDLTANTLARKALDLANAK